MIFGAHRNISFIIKVEIHVLIDLSYKVPSIVLTTEPRMVIISSAHGTISSEHIYFQYLFLEAHLTTYHSNIGVQKEK